MPSGHSNSRDHGSSFRPYSVRPLDAATYPARPSLRYAGNTVEGAQLQLYVGKNTQVTAIAASDQPGQFEFTHLRPARDYRLRVTHSGYVSIEAAGSLQAGETRQLQITLDARRALSNAVTEINRVGCESRYARCRYGGRQRALWRHCSPAPAQPGVPLDRFQSTAAARNSTPISSAARITSTLPQCRSHRAGRRLRCSSSPVAA